MTTQLSIPQNALEVKEVQPFMALCFSTRATLSTLSQHAPDVAQHLYQEASRLHLDIAGPIQWIYTGTNGDEMNEFQLEIALPVSQPVEEPAEFRYQVFPSFRCVSYTQTGPWSDFGKLYNALYAQLYRDGHKNDGRVREIYTVIDFENPENCVTELQIAIV